MVRLKLSFINGKGEWLSTHAQTFDCDSMSAWTSKIRPGGWYELWSFAIGDSSVALGIGFIDSLDEEPPDTQGDTHRDTQEIHGDERSSGADSPALAALIDQLAKKDEQIAKLMETVADSTKAVQGAQALDHEEAKAVLGKEVAAFSEIMEALAALRREADRNNIQIRIDDFDNPENE